MKRALVLGGGGVVGVAWETGVMAGLREAGVDPTEVFDAVVGTSAGAIVGAQMLAGVLSEDPRKPDQREARATSEPPVDFTKLDPDALRKIFEIWRTIEQTTPELAAQIGVLAAAQNPDGEATYVERMSKQTRVERWPDTLLRVCTVHTQTGERQVFDRDSGVEVGRALAASAAVPGMFPSVTIGGARYMDGQVHSSTNADILIAAQPGQVWIAMPTNGHNARSMGRHAQRAVDQEIAALEAAGSRVSFRTPSEADAESMGQNLMDPRAVEPAFEAGLATGKAWAGELD